MAIGALTPPIKVNSILANAGKDARQISALVLHARKIAMSILGGWHGKRKQGSGDSFWQFRPYDSGESANRIDWRRSARDNTLYIRDREWEAAQTVFLWPDQSPSMQYKSKYCEHSKEERALLLALILGEVFAQNGERIAIPSILPPISARNGAERMAISLVNHQPAANSMDLSVLSRYSHLIIASDFLDDMSVLEQRFTKLAELNIRVHLIQISDPSEEVFPYQGHVLFQDPESGFELDAGRAQIYQQDYCQLFAARRAHLKDICRHYGWGFCLSLTDEPVTKTLSALNIAMNADLGFRRGHIA
ncbi:DUF58 domain-containing protein [Bartonella sp. HY406]|uniref:DUF58 domain-containing protein n=1 Tax=Bartonella sp. HY406 TaxID=2979331 RepID=UPI0021C6005C|nr:DUF58 domain-containing protein [Bartonella sp. HY406]UXN02301.1 DUF58 domain-containing protein [Bartonella sp. HY406]